MALNQFTNNAGTTLASGINASVTSLTVSTGSGALFPTLTGSAYFYCTLQQVSGGGIEIVKVTARSTDTFTIVRAQDGTTGLSFVTGDTVQLRLTAADLNNFPQLDSTNTFASAQTFTAAPILTALTGVVYGNGASASTVATGAQLATAIGSTSITNATNVTGTVGVANGGTGVATLTTAYGVLAAGTTATGAVQNIGTGTTNQVLTSNGPGVLPSFKAASGGQLQTQLFISPSTWTNPGSVTQVRVLVIGAGGGSGSKLTTGSGTGGGGGVGYAVNVPVSGPVAVTIGVAGAGGTFPGSGASGGTSSFGSLVSCTGGGGGVPSNPTPTAAIPGTPGSATISSGTPIVKSNSNTLNGGFLSGGGNFHDIVGTGTTTVQSATAYSDTLNIFAGSGAPSNPTPGSVPGFGGINGAVLVEFVG